MPELADVEGHRRLVAERAGATVERVTVPDPELLRGTSPQGLGRALTGRRLDEPDRHGKWLMLAFGDRRLVLHFGMTGYLEWLDADDDIGERASLAIALDGAMLVQRTVRRLGGAWYLAPGQELRVATGPLGPDARELGRERLAALLDGRRGGLKSALMDQELIAGLGNELVDEILWRGGLHPRVGAAELGEAQLDELYAAMREVLRRSVRAGHVPSGPTWLNGQRGVEEPVCPRCDAELERGQVAGRTSYWCPRDQAS